MMAFRDEWSENNTQKIKFAKRSSHDKDFFAVLKKRVADYFESKNLSQNGNFELYFKSFLIAIIYLFTYSALISDHFQGIIFILLFTFMGILKALMGFNLTHDALHGAYSSLPLVNRLLGHTFDINGTSSFVWKISHNGKHHTYTNIPGIDQDIEKAITLRFSPKDRLYWFHYFQNWYAPILYCFTGIYWVFVSDYIWFLTESRNANVKRSDVFIFLALKILNLFMFIIFPLIYLSVSWSEVLLGYLGLQIVGGFTIAIVFQLAHLVEGLQFPEPDCQGNMQNNWAIHEMITTSNFATKNRLVTFLVGGLNFQIEHHLFPYISHIHYPEISKIVKNTAQEFQIPYNEIPTFWGAVKSHFRILKQLGRYDTFTLHKQANTGSD